MWELAYDRRRGMCMCTQSNREPFVRLLHLPPSYLSISWLHGARVPNETQYQTCRHNNRQKRLVSLGFEPRTYCVWGRRDTTTPWNLACIFKAVSHRFNHGFWGIKVTHTHSLRIILCPQTLEWVVLDRRARHAHLLAKGAAYFWLNKNFDFEKVKDQGYPFALLQSLIWLWITLTFLGITYLFPSFFCSNIQILCTANQHPKIPPENPYRSLILLFPPSFCSHIWCFL